MSGKRGYRVQRLSRARLALAAGQEMAGRRHLMFALVGADLTAPIQLMAQYQARCAEKLSLAGYVATCLARALPEYPEVNAFRRGRSLVLLDEVIVVVQLERRIDGQPAVGHLPIRHADTKTLLDVTREIPAARFTSRLLQTPRLRGDGKVAGRPRSTTG
jgi:pyruvate/2-oxoglutarate dehydrogenase complex dihydrolipoamide acyltransferase (E2) component